MSVASPCSGKRTVGGKEGIHWSTGDLEWGQRVLQLWLKSKDKKNWGKPTLGLGKGKELFTHPHRSWYQAGQVCTQISFVVVFGFRHHSFPESEWWQFVKYPHPWLPLDQNLSRMRLSLLRCLRGVMSQTVSCLSAVLSRQLKPAEIQEREEDKLWTPPEHTQLEQTWPGTNTRRLHVYKHACQHLCSSTLPATWNSQ